MFGQFRAQVGKVFDYTVVDHGNAAGTLRMGILHIGGAMGRPTGVPYTGLARKWAVDQEV